MSNLQLCNLFIEIGKIQKTKEEKEIEECFFKPHLNRVKLN